jgi:hypothetical protein
MLAPLTVVSAIPETSTLAKALNGLRFEKGKAQ